MTATDTFAPDDVLNPTRRRIYLMRHGSVDYFTDEGTPVRPDTVVLNARGREQADAAGALFAAAGVRFDHVLTSGLARTVETAQRVLAASGHDLPVHQDPDLEEIRPGRIHEIPREQILQAFLGAFDSADESTSFLGGERIGSLLDRVLPAFDALLGRTHWNCLLLVLHGGVNRALLGHALLGGRTFLGAIEQNPACINVLDVADRHPLQQQTPRRQFVVRAINLAPTQWLHADERRTTMETLLAEFMRPRTT